MKCLPSGQGGSSRRQPVPIVGSKAEHLRLFRSFFLTEAWEGSAGLERSDKTAEHKPEALCAGLYAPSRGRCPGHGQARLCRDIAQWRSVVLASIIKQTQHARPEH